MAQILTKDYSKASQTLNAVAKPDATTSYLKAIVAARTNDANAVISNLKAAIAADKAMAKEAAIDLNLQNMQLTANSLHWLSNNKLIPYIRKAASVKKGGLLFLPGNAFS